MEGERIPLGNLPPNRDNYLQVAKAYSKRLSIRDGRDPDKAWAEMLPPTISPSRAIIGNHDCITERWAKSAELERMTISSLRILSDAFYYKCGYRDYRDVNISDKEQKDWRKRSQPNGPRSKCVLERSKELEKETGLKKEDLVMILRYKAFGGMEKGNAETSLGREAQNAAAHEQCVGVVAYHLARYFNSKPDTDARKRTEAMFKWVTGKGFEAAAAERDGRILTRESVKAATGMFEELSLSEEDKKYIRVAMA